MFKKGDVVWEAMAWNFSECCGRAKLIGYYEIPSDYSSKYKWREKTQEEMDLDIYNIEKWTVYSCGKKQMYLCDAEGMKGRRILEYQYHNFVESEEAAIAKIEMMRANDQDRRPNYIIEHNRSAT